MSGLSCALSTFHFTRGFLYDYTASARSVHTRTETYGRTREGGELPARATSHQQEQHQEHQQLHLDEIVVAAGPTPRAAEATCGGDPRGELEYELVEAVTVFHEVLRVLVDVVAGQIELLQNAVRVQGKCENRAPSAPMSV
jgi:hypothetical protein